MYRINENNQVIQEDGFVLEADDIKVLKRIQDELFEKGIIVSFDETVNIWCNYSNSLQASWLFLNTYEKDITNMISEDRSFTTWEEYVK